MKIFYCNYSKYCKFSGTRQQVRKHLREEHLVNKGSVGEICNHFYSIDTDTGERMDYKKKKRGGIKGLLNEAKSA